MHMFRFMGSGLGRYGDGNSVALLRVLVAPLQRKDVALNVSRKEEQFIGVGPLFYMLLGF